MRIFITISLSSFLFLLQVSMSFALSWEYTETFENHNAPGNAYVSGTFSGDNDVSWSYVKCRADYNYRINPDNKSFMLASTGEIVPTISSSVISGGIKDFRVKMRKAFTGSGNRRIALYINGKFIASSIAWDNTEVQVLELNNLDIIGDIVIEIQNEGLQVVIDDLSWTKFSGGNGGTPSKLTISKQIPANVMKNIPFKVLIELTDKNNVKQTLAQDTRIDFRILDENDNLLFSNTYQMPAFCATLFIDSLILNYAGKVKLIAEAPENKNTDSYYISDYRKTITISQTPILSIDVYDKGHVGAVHPPIIISALSPEGSINSSYDGYEARLHISGAAYEGTVDAIFIAGVAVIDDLVFKTANSEYQISASGEYLPISEPQTVKVSDKPVMSEIIIPEFMKCGDSIPPLGTGRIPTFALVTINNLHPDTEYRFYSGATESITGNPVNASGGFLAVNQLIGDYNYTELKSLNKQGQYSTFRTGTGENFKTLWINTVPDDNAIFNINKEIYWVVEIGSNKGTSISKLYTSKRTRNLQLSTSQNNFTTGLISYASGIYDLHSPSAAKNYIVLYDESDNAISTTIVQGCGAFLKTSEATVLCPEYYALTESSDGAWATIIPNNLSGGIRKIVEYTHGGNIVNTWTDDDGIWAEYNTISGNFGLNPPKETSADIFFAVPQIELIYPFDDSIICNNYENSSIKWNSRGISETDIFISRNNGEWQLLADDVDARIGEYLWDITENSFTGTKNQIRLVCDEFDYIGSVSGKFEVFDSPFIESISESNVWCKGEDIKLNVAASGTDLQYQWLKDGEKLKEGVNYECVNCPALFITDLNSDLSGVYTVMVSGHGTCNQVHSKPIIVYVAGLPEITAPVNDKEIFVLPGDMVTLSFILHGNSGFNEDDVPEYQDYEVLWYKIERGQQNAILISDEMQGVSGSRSNYLTLNSFCKNSEGTYYAEIKSLCGNRIRTPMYILNEAEVSIIHNPDDIEICMGYDAEFSFDYQTSIEENIEIRWFKDGFPIFDCGKYSGTDCKTLRINCVNRDDGGNYSAQISILNSNNSTESKIGKLNVIEAPIIFSQTSGRIEQNEGSKLSLEVIPVSYDEAIPLKYQWFKDGNQIDAADDSIYTVESVEYDDEGIYHCEISNICGKIESEKIQVTVLIGGVSSIHKNSMHLNAFGLPVPNPVNNLFEISVELVESDFFELYISDLYANKNQLFSEKFLIEGKNILTIDVSRLNLATGTYFLTLKSRNSVVTRKIMLID